MRLLRTIRLDPSDRFIFPKASEPGEWAVSGAFVFSDDDLTTLEGKHRAAFRGGFLGIPSLGWSTLAQIVDADADDRAAAIEALARCLQGHFGAPSPAAAHAAAEEEIDFASSLCNHSKNTLIGVHRDHEDGAIRESFRALRPRAGSHPFHGLAVLEAVADEEPGEAGKSPIAGREARK
jgi:hypothetical protein